MNIDWQSRELWHRIGYAASALWMGYVLVKTEGEISHPFFDYIFIVPIGMWLGGVVVARLLRGWRGP